jgi:hypothetical protein
LNIIDYLKIEFEVYPRLFRDLANFLPKQEQMEKVTNPTFHRFCPDCQGKDASVIEVETKKGVRYRVSCSCGKEGPIGLSEFSAIWQWVTLKGMPTNLVENPLINTERYLTTRKKWEKHDEVTHLAAWIAALNFHKRICDAHRDTPDYQSLSEKDKEFVNVLPLLNRLLKKEATLRLEELSFAISSDECQRKIQMEESYVAKDRKSVYERFKDTLTPGFHFKVRELYCI